MEVKNAKPRPGFVIYDLEGKPHTTRPFSLFDQDKFEEKIGCELDQCSRLSTKDWIQFLWMLLQHEYPSADAVAKAFDLGSVLQAVEFAFKVAAARRDLVEG